MSKIRGSGSKPLTSREKYLAMKGNQTFSPYTYYQNTTNASKKCWKEFGKLKRVQACFPPLLQAQLPCISTMETIHVSFMLEEYQAHKKSHKSTSTEKWLLL